RAVLAIFTSAVSRALCGEVQKFVPDVRDTNIPRRSSNRPGRNSASSGASFHGETTAGEDSFALSILWDSMHPEQARVSLHSNSLDNLEARGPLTYLFKADLSFGGFVDITVA
ncbi:hypothetical protein KDX09_37150, partial [Burkholderia cenocepacia]|nr:hypothetical protein [Burkholderia cenocepacia]